MKLSDLLDSSSANVKAELSVNPDVTDVSFPLDVSALPIVKREWISLDSVYVVTADLRGSTRLGTGKHAASTAAIFQASTGGLIDIFDGFNADFVQIQGDGAFAIFWDRGAFERAICSAITVRTFSADLAAQLASKWPDAPATGFKIGVATGRSLVKRIGKVARPDWQEPVWAGKPVNYSVKAAQAGDTGSIVVTGSVWDQIENNDFLSMSCTCGGGPSNSIWSDFTIDNLPDGDDERFGRKLGSQWCTFHGEEYCNAVLAGKTRREDVESQRNEVLRSQRATSLRDVASRNRKNLAARRKGLAA